MKHYLLSVGIILCTYLDFAQTPELNQEKYWKFRNTYKEKFMKIGGSLGESLPSRALLPYGCVDTWEADVDGTTTGVSMYGMMKWGDGMIRHGHYLTLLATEYRLLTNNSQTQQAQATLNELYYALNAVWRLDLNAEENQDLIHGTNVAFSENLNGFYNREDVGKNFSSNHWGNDPMKMQCTYGAFYTNSNTNKTGEHGNSYQNTPSMDQLAGLLTGLAMVATLVDPVVVQPSLNDDAIDVKQWAKDIMFYLIKNPASNNWFMIDVTGWPVNNGGGDVAFFAAPLQQIMNRFVGPIVLPEIAYRKVFPYKHAQAYATGYGLEGPYDYDDPVNIAQYVYFSSVLFDIENSQFCPTDYGTVRTSNFLSWQACGLELPVLGINSFSANLWNNAIPDNIALISSDWENNHRFDETLPFLVGQIEFDENPLKARNNNIMLSMGILSGTWSQENVATWAENTENRELELVNSIINSQSAPHPASFYKSFLDAMSFSGPYNLEGAHWNGTTSTNFKEKFHPNGWAGEYRWTSPDEAIGIGGEKGIYSALDYMVMYNLYHLKFGGTGMPPYKAGWTCACENEIIASGPGGPDDQDAYNNLNAKLVYLDNCQENVFYPVNNMVGSVFNIEPKFSDYSSWGIFPTKYQTENASVLPSGQIKVKTQFVVCNGELNIQAGALVDVENKEMIVSTNGVVKNSGVLLVRAGTQLVLKSGSKLILNNGGKLKVEHGAKLIIEEGATLEYYNGAEIILETETAEIYHGGTIKTKDATTFSILSQSTTNKKGKFIVNSPTAAFVADAQPTYFKLEGYGITDPFLTINPNAKLSINDPDIITFKIADCLTELKEGASIRAEETVYNYNTKFFSTANNGGYTLTDAHQFVGCTFSQVPVKAMMNIENKFAFSANNCTFNAPSSALNLLDHALLKVTGMGLNVSNCTFTANRKYCIESSALTRSSSISTSTFSQNGVASGSVMSCLNDLSNVEFVITNSSFEKAQYAIYKSSGKLSLKCNQFINNDYCNIKALNGCTVNMSINDLAGYNILNKSLQNRNIEITSCPLSLKNGYNFIEECTKTISGTTPITCTPPGCSVDLTNNQWNSGNTVPNLANFQIQTSGTNYIVSPIVSPKAAKPACGYYDGTIIIDPPKTKSTFDVDGMPIIWSDLLNDSIRLNTAIVRAMEKMSSYNDSLGNDLEAIERFNEVFSSDVNPNDSLTRNYLWFAFDYMKSTLENAFTKHQISYTQNATQFEPHVAMYVNALRLMTDSLIDEDNYRTQFYHEIDKAHLFRVIGQPQIGLNILEELEYCGIDSTEQAQLNYWKTVFQEDLIIEVIGNDFIDTTIVIDTTGFIQPQVSVNQYSFGAIINDLNSIQYPNCDFFHSKELLAQRTAKQLNLYPNPAVETVTVSVVSDVDGAGQLSFETSDGRKVHSKDVDIINNAEYTVNVSNWNPGVYLVTLTYSDGKKITKRLVVK